MSLQATISAAIAASLVGSGKFGKVAHDLAYSPVIQLADGSGANQANKLFADSRTVLASATDSLDLSGALNDALGQSLVLTRVAAIMVKASANNGGDLLVGPAAANGFVGPFNAAADRVKVKPGGLILLVAPTAAGFPVVAGTGDLLNIVNANAGASGAYDIVVVGS
jgi:hypothetical protein